MWIIVTCISRNHCLATFLAWEQSCACWKHAVWNKDWKKQNQTGIVCLVIFSPILPTRLIQRSLFRDWTYLVLNVQNQHHTGVRRPEARLIAHPEKKLFHPKGSIYPRPCNVFRVQKNITLSGPLHTAMALGARCFCGRALQNDPQLMKSLLSLYFLTNLIIRINQAFFFFPSYSAFSLIFRVQTSHLPVVLPGCWNQNSITVSKSVKPEHFPWHERSLKNNNNNNTFNNNKIREPCKAQPPVTRDS